MTAALILVLPLPLLLLLLQPILVSNLLSKNSRLIHGVLLCYAMARVSLAVADVASGVIIQRSLIKADKNYSEGTNAIQGDLHNKSNKQWLIMQNYDAEDLHERESPVQADETATTGDQSDDTKTKACETTKPDGSKGYFACPSSNSAPTDTHCCRGPTSQYCCSADEYKKIEDKKNSALNGPDLIQQIGLMVIGLACAVVFSCCLFIIICLCIVQPKWRKRTAVGAMKKTSSGSDRTWNSGKSDASVSSNGSQRSLSPTSRSPGPRPPEPRIPLSLQLPPPPYTAPATSKQ